MNNTGKRPPPLNREVEFIKLNGGSGRELTQEELNEFERRVREHVAFMRKKGYI